MQQSLKQWPGPKQWPIIGSFPDLIQRVKKFDMFAPKALASYFDDYKTDSFFVKFGPVKFLVTKDMELLRKVTKGDPDKYHKLKKGFLFADMLGDSLVLSEGDMWKKKRALYRNAFKKGALESFIPIMHQSAIELEQAWLKDGQNGAKPIDVTEGLTRLTMDVIGRCGFGYDFKAQTEPEKASAAKNLDTVLECIQVQIEDPLGLFLSTGVYKAITPNGRRYEQALQRLTAIVDSVITAPPSQKTNLLYYLKEAAKEEGDLKLTNKDFRDEVLLFFFAGHETTSTALSWTLYYLNQSPEIRKKVLEEINDVIGNTDKAPDWSTLNRLTYTNQVFKETLRLRPAVGAVSRAPNSPEEHKGIPIDPDTFISIPIWTVHRDPRNWEEPVEKFDPDRFSEEKSEQRDQLAWLPFGITPRNCIGMQFAMVEARVALAYLLPRLDFTQVKEPKLVEKLLVRPVGNVMKVKARNS